MTFDELKEKALQLPYAPGVYIMRDAEDTVIYVGKAKKLKNRVSQYFQDTASHSPKTRLMVSKIHHFDVIVAASEFEALILECAQIKRYMPKYNILLKDDKGYPYLRLDRREKYPKITLANRITDDGAEYFGPFGSRGVTQSVLQTITDLLRLPKCNKRFPKDAGKARPCLNYHLGQCDGWCRSEDALSGYGDRVEQGRQLLLGNYRTVSEQLRSEMLKASEDLNFELAASLRDRLRSVDALGQKQTVVAGNHIDTDVIGYGQTDSKACFSMLHYSGGDLADKEYQVFPTPEDPVSAVSSLIKQYYSDCGYIPKQILLPFAVEDMELMEQFLTEKNGKRCYFRVPKRGDNLRLVELACKNAATEAERITSKEEKRRGSLTLLGKLLNIPAPARIESFDISHISGTDIVASMVVFQDGKPKSGDYKRFKLEGMTDQDDYGAMRQVLERRFDHYVQGDAGFENAPDLLLIDGGDTHAAVAESVLQERSLTIPVFGMVKDDRHRTRALITSEGLEIGIAAQQSVFALIGNIQEETHRFAIRYHRKLRSKRLRRSALDNIPGVGEKRKQLLLKQFGSISSISGASLIELKQFLPENAAIAVYRHFHKEED